MKKGKDDFGDRMKNYESQTTSDKLIPRLPVIARLDGHSFSKFTKGLKRPYDKRMSDLMIETTKYLSSKYNTNIAYTQSDEITLIWYLDDYKSNMIFNGKLFKLTSLMASSASVFFNKKNLYSPTTSVLLLRNSVLSDNHILPSGSSVLTSHPP